MLNTHMQLLVKDIQIFKYPIKGRGSIPTFINQSI